MLALLGALLPAGAGAREIPRSVLPGVAEDSVREAVDVSRAPWRGVGRVQVETGEQCTGALIGPRTVLTAAHCVFGARTANPVRPASVHFLVGYSRGEYAGHARATSVRVGRGFVPTVGGTPSPASPADADWALLTLDAPLGTPDRVLPLLRDRLPVGTPLMLGGYGQDRAHAMVADLSCRWEGLVRLPNDSVMLGHDCAGTRGSSGGPLLARGADGTWAVVAVQSVARVGAAGGYAVPVAAVVEAAAAAPRSAPPGRGAVPGGAGRGGGS